MWNLFGLEIYVTKPLEIEVADDIFHVTDHYGPNCIVKRAIPANIYLKNMLIAQEALARWRYATLGGNVIPLRR